MIVIQRSSSHRLSREQGDANQWDTLVTKEPRILYEAPARISFCKEYCLSVWLECPFA